MANKVELKKGPTVKKTKFVQDSLEQQLTQHNAELALENAHHWQSANEIPKAIEYLEKAGEHARQMGDFEEATRFFNKSLALNT